MEGYFLFSFQRNSQNSELNGTDRSWSVCLDLVWGRVAPKPPNWGDGQPSPQPPLGKEILHGRRWVASLCWGFEADPYLSLVQVWAYFRASKLRVRAERARLSVLKPIRRIAGCCRIRFVGALNQSMMLDPGQSAT